MLISPHLRTINYHVSLIGLQWEGSNHDWFLGIPAAARRRKSILTFPNQLSSQAPKRAIAENQAIINPSQSLKNPGGCCSSRVDHHTWPEPQISPIPFPDRSSFGLPNAVIVVRLSALKRPCTVVPTLGVWLLKLPLLPSPRRCKRFFLSSSRFITTQDTLPPIRTV